MVQKTKSEQYLIQYSTLDENKIRSISLSDYEDKNTFDLIFYCEDEGSQFVTLKAEDLRPLKSLLDVLFKEYEGWL